MLTLFGAGQAFAGEVALAKPLQTAPAFREDQLLIKPKANVASEKLASFNAIRSAQVRRKFTGGIQVVSVPAGETVSSLIAKYQQSGLVDFAEPDYIRHTDATLPNDPKFVDGTQWTLNNYGQNGGTTNADLNAPEAWDIRTSAEGIVVAVLDTGVRYTHEDLAANMWTNPRDGSHGLNAVAGTTDPSDDNGHGTMMAGLLGAVGNNGKGIAGVAWNVQIMACKCFDNFGSGTDSAILACIDYARTNGARIINAGFDSPGYSQSLSNAIYALREAGIIFVTSSGNNTNNVDVNPRYPACYQIDNIVSVAYTTRTDALGFVSNYGATNVDLAAPGDQVYTTYSPSDTSYFPPSGLPINLAGTSFAAAHVSGALALMFAQYPGLSHREIISLLKDATDPLAALAGKCLTGGRLNLRKALSRPLVSALSDTSNPVHLRVLAGPNRSCVVESSADLASWTPVITNTTSASGYFDFNPNPDSSTHRFYRTQCAP